MLQTTFANPNVSRHPSSYNPKYQVITEDMKWHEVPVFRYMDSTAYDTSLNLNFKEESLV